MAREKDKKIQDEPDSELASLKRVESEALPAEPMRGSYDDCKRVCVEGPPMECEEGGGDDAKAALRGLGTRPPNPVPVTVPSPVPVTLQRSATNESDDQALWVAIRNRTQAIGFEKYEEFVTRCLCGAPIEDKVVSCDEVPAKDRLHFGVDGYRRLKTATEAFLIARCGLLPVRLEGYDATAERERLGRGVDAKDMISILARYLGISQTTDAELPYISTLLSQAELDDRADSPYCDTLLTGDPMSPCFLELIWSYWHEEGMLAQSINAIALRFQNKRTGASHEALTELELSPLRPLSNLIWGYIQDEPFRLTVARRAYEYLHHYGLPLHGRAVANLQPAESRARFLEAFHSLLYQAALFYEKDSDTTVIADGFAVLNALKEVHLQLAEGAHNQFRDLPWTARAEMLIQQWLLSRREMKEFLRGRQMVPFKERWMGQVDTLKRLYGMTATPVTYFRDLGVFGEQLLLSVRYADWNRVVDQNQAKNWARYWKPEVQSYIHAYRAVTGVDLAASAQRQQPVNATPPALLLQQRLMQQRAR